MWLGFQRLDNREYKILIMSSVLMSYIMFNNTQWLLYGAVTKIGLERSTSVLAALQDHIDSMSRQFVDIDYPS